MLLEPFSPFLSHRSLLVELTRREIAGRYRGANFGILWSLISPFLMLAVYAIAFGAILQTRWPSSGGREPGFALVLYVGLIVHGLFAECVVRAPHLITGNVNLVKRVVFPLDMLPWTLVLSALFHALMNIVVFIVLHGFIAGWPPPTVFLMPVILLPMLPALVGVSALLAALGVYVRDITQVTGVLVTAMLFISSAIVPPEVVPERYRIYFDLNPLTFIINQMRDVALWGHAPDWSALGIYLIVSVIVMYLGFAVFTMTRRGFADVL